jgi:hypothetical protein
MRENGGEITTARCVLSSMRTMNEPPILATIPRSGTWFLRYTISFLSHLERGGRIEDRLTGSVVGPPSGAPFDFHGFKGGPLFGVRGTMPVDHLFIGHTVCPGFGAIAAKIDWWKHTPFHVKGYDYLHEGMNYRYTPVELAPYQYAPIQIAPLERSAAKGRGPRTVLVYRHPLDQAASYYRYCQDHKNASYSSFKGRPLASVGFDDYLFDCALPSYAKQFISFQLMAERYPGLVRLVAYEDLVAKPVEAIADILDHLSASTRPRPALSDAVWLARREHMAAIERELGRSLDGTRAGGRSHMRMSQERWFDGWLERRTHDRALTMLRDLGVDTDWFQWAAGEQPASAA